MSALWEQDPTYTTLRRYLLEHKDELIAMLHRWDEDSDGCINATEFRQACRVLQLDAGLKMKIPREVFDELYEELDVNNTENIPFDDLETTKDLRFGSGTWLYDCDKPSKSQKVTENL